MGPTQSNLFGLPPGRCCQSFFDSCRGREVPRRWHQAQHRPRREGNQCRNSLQYRDFRPKDGPKRCQEQPSSEKGGKLWYSRPHGGHAQVSHQCAPNDPELFKYRKLSADRCEITGLEGRYAGQLVNPSRIQGLQVVSIADRAFMGRTGLKTVILPSKVRKVGRFAFYGCKYLKGVQFPNIANLEPLCFGGCSNLELAAVYSSGPSKEDGTIADNAFFKNGGTLWFRAQWDSEAARFARRKGYQLLP